MILLTEGAKMEQSINGLFSTSFLVFALVIAIFTQAFRSVIEGIFMKVGVIFPEKVKDALVVFWRQWVLRALPIVAGGLMGWFLLKYPYPNDFAATRTAHVFFGLIAGIFSSTIYDLVKYHAAKYLPDDVKKKIDAMNPLSKDQQKDSK